MRRLQVSRVVPAPHKLPFDLAQVPGQIRLAGELHLAHGRALWRELCRATTDARSPLAIDLSEVTGVDGTVVALLVELRARLARRGITAEISGASAHVAELVTLYGGYEAPRPSPPATSPGFFVTLGEGAVRVVGGARRMIEFVGDVVRGALGALVRPITGNWKSTFSLVARAGADAIPLVLLLNFLLGFVMGYESSRQLEKYGAHLFVADVVGIAVTRELSPVMTSIIVIGRSGAAYTAELGTMRVSEELDALRTMGFSPLRHLILPRILTLALVTPLLTLLGDVTGVVGGAVVGATTLGITPHAYLAELRTTLVPRDVLGGLVKAAVAGTTIALIAAQQGFATTGGPAGVGHRTTSTVVKCLVALVLIDALFAILLRLTGT